MTDHDALYRSICAHPADDTPRLVYADWLEEHDRPEEAEFIRLECRLGSITPDDPDYTDLLERADELRLLLRLHVPGPDVKLAGGLQVRGGEWWWGHTARGFPRYLEFFGHDHPGLKPIRVMVAALEKAFTKVPTRWLVVRSITTPQLAELLRQPVIAKLDLLTLVIQGGNEAPDEVCQLIADCQYLGDLRGLCLEFPVDDAGVRRLGQARALSRLRWLAMEQCASLTAGGIRALGASDWFRGLIQISLNELREDAFTELARLPDFPDLHTLELDDAAYGLAAWQTFAHSATFPRLAYLKNHTDMSHGQAAALASADGFRLSALDMHGAAIGTAGARALTTAPWFGSLQRLSLSANRIGPAGVAALARSRKLARLRHLNLNGNTPGAVGLGAIAANPALRGLVTLLLGGGSSDTNRGLTAAALNRFLARLDMPHLRRLDLFGRPIGTAAARELASGKFASLRRLNLGWCKLGDAAVTTLLTAPSLQDLIELDLTDNRLKTGLAPLTDRCVMPHLSACRLHKNRPGAELAKKLARRPGVYL